AARAGAGRAAGGKASAGTRHRGVESRVQRIFLSVAFFPKEIDRDAGQNDEQAGPSVALSLGSKEEVEGDGGGGHNINGRKHRIAKSFVGPVCFWLLAAQDE